MWYAGAMLSKKLIINTLCEFGPILSFILAFEIWDFKAGTIAMMGTVLVALFVLKRTENHLPIFALLSTITVILFGGVSLVVDIPSIFILRDTIFDGLFGAVLLVSVFMKKPLFQYLFHNVFAITFRGWNILSLRWGVFFILLALSNEWIRHMVTPEAWVLAKVLMIVASFVFGILQFPMIRRHRLPEASSWGMVE